MDYQNRNLFICVFTLGLTVFVYLYQFQWFEDAMFVVGLMIVAAAMLTLFFYVLIGMAEESPFNSDYEHPDIVRNRELKRIADSLERSEDRL